MTIHIKSKEGAFDVNLFFQKSLWTRRLALSNVLSLRVLYIFRLVFYESRLARQRVRRTFFLPGRYRTVEKFTSGVSTGSHCR